MNKIEFVILFLILIAIGFNSFLTSRNNPEQTKIDIAELHTEFDRFVKVVERQHNNFEKFANKGKRFSYIDGIALQHQHDENFGCGSIKDLYSDKETDFRHYLEEYYNCKK